MRDGYYKRLLTTNIKPIVAAIFGSKVLMGYQPGTSLTAAGMNLSFDKTSAEHTADIANYTLGYSTALTGASIEMQAFVPPALTDLKGVCYSSGPGVLATTNGYTYLSATQQDLVIDGFKPVIYASTNKDPYGHPCETCVGTAVLWMSTGTAWECWAIPVGKLLRSRFWRKLRPNFPTVYDSDMVLSNAVCLVVGGMSGVEPRAIVQLNATSRPGDAYTSSFRMMDVLGTAVAQAFGSGVGFGLSPNGRVLTTKVDLLPKGMSFASHEACPGTIWASIQGHCLRGYLTRLLTRGGRTMTTDETTQMTNLKSMSLLAGRFSLAPVVGPANVWDDHPFGAYQNESNFGSIDVSGQGDTTSDVKARIKNGSWTGWAADTQSAPAPLVAYNWDSTNHAMVWRKNGAVTRYAAAVNAMKVGAVLDPTSSSTAMESDVTLTENQKVGYRNQIVSLLAAYGTMMVYNTFNDVHADYGKAVSGVTWVNAHVNAKTTKLASMLSGIINTLMTPFSAGDLQSYGVASEATAVRGANL